MLDYKISPLGDQAILIRFGDEVSIQINQIVHIIKDKIEQAQIKGIIDLVPAFHTLTIHYNPFLIDHPKPYNSIIKKIEEILNQEIKPEFFTKKVVNIPVCYDLEFGHDLPFVANVNGLTENEVVSIHSSNLYQVFFIGFAPGFPFLGGMDARIATPRKSTPRLKVAAGSVGIAGKQTGIYPLETPGGWQIIGRTPFKLFNVDQKNPTLLKPGEQVQFFPISKEQYERWDDEQWE